ncbi:AAA domain-containing protein [Saprospira grandis]|uniref:DNA helicase n=1 Tax=Saprospira grandis (strain Lewin) TaxID=984262 RepID=H6LA05_SAPGL|nr:AAA domain-containing protein [Saprospira grandis]AFC24368.1 AAA ATPase [Saprospira grandis str. Lewin]
MKATEEIQALMELLEEEKQEEIKQYRYLLEQLPLKERIEKGVCWHPVRQERTGWSLGEHPYVTISRMYSKDQAHKFRSGTVVGIFPSSNFERKKSIFEYGVVQYIKKDEMKIILYGKELPSWVMHEQIGVQLAFDERSYLEMGKALKYVAEAQDNRLSELREILLGKMPARFQDHRRPGDLGQLNNSQAEAVQQILAAEDVAVVHGPPGTGKTTTLVAAIKELVKRESPVLVCAPSNPASDLLTERLADQGLNVVRVGNVSRLDEKVLQHSIEGILQERAEMKEVKKMKKEAAELFRKAGKFKRKFGPNERNERRETYQEAKNLIRHARMMEDYVIEKVLSEADAICCTLVSSMNRYIENRRFHTVVIDEAAQALEPACWIAIAKADKVILAGDPFQLPPTVKSRKAAQKGLSITLLEKAVERLDRVQLLKTQYRMHEQIMQFSNQYFYEGQLQAADFVKNWTLAMRPGGDTTPVEFIDTAGCSFDEKINPETLSSYNPEEYYILRQHLDHLLSFADKQVRPSIAVISPYREQVRFMQEQMETDFDHFPDDDITIDTIDAFQGQERDVVYISLVRSNERGEIGFLKDTRRLNVAMTRARKKLIIIGDSATLGQHPFYQSFMDYCEKHGKYASAWEWM